MPRLSRPDRRHRPVRAGEVLVLARGRRLFDGLPRLMRAGLVLAALGGTIDVAYHLGTDAAGAGHGSVAFIGHLVTLVGMLVTMLGLAHGAYTRRPVNAQPTTEGEGL